MAESGSKHSEKDEVHGRVKEIFCQPCLGKSKRTIGAKFCTNCNEFQCTDCSNIHTTFAISKHHNLVNASEASRIGMLFDMKGLDQCDQHKELLKFFCEDDKQLCCSTCAIVDHRKCHSVVEVEKIAETMTSPMSTLNRKLQETKEKAEDIIKHLISSKEKLEQDMEEVLGTIRRMRDEVTQLFDDLEIFIMKRAKGLQKKSLVKMTKKQSQSEKYLSDVTASLETIDNVYKNGTSMQKFIVEQKMENDVNIVYRNVNEEYQNLETVNISFHFGETLKLPPFPITEHVPGQLISKYHRQGNVDSSNKAITITSVSSIPVKKTGDDESEPFYSGIDFLPDGRLVAVDIINKKCLVYNNKLEKVGSYQLSYPPHSVVAVSEEEVAITIPGQYKIEFLHVSKSNEITSVRICKVKTQYGSICLKDNTQFVVGCINHSIPVRIVSFTGEEKDFSINFPNKSYSIGTSFCTYIKSSDKVVITDAYEHTVYIYDIKTNTRVVVKDDKIQLPCGVAVGPSDTFLVCSYRTNSIVQVSQTGCILASYKTDMELPFGVCVSRDKPFLVVTNWREGKRKLQKFKISN